MAIQAHFFAPIKIKKGEAKKIRSFGEFGEVVFPADEGGEDGWRVVISRYAFLR
jgi:hypothetical protein